MCAVYPDEYEFPSIDLLKDLVIVENGIGEDEIYKNAKINSLSFSLK